MCHIFPFPDLQSGAIWFLFYAKNKKYTFYTLSLYLLVSNSASTIAGVYPELKIEKAVPEVLVYRLQNNSCSCQFNCSIWSSHLQNTLH